MQVCTGLYRLPLLHVLKCTRQTVYDESWSTAALHVRCEKRNALHSTRIQYITAGGLGGSARDRRTLRRQPHQLAALGVVRAKAAHLGRREVWSQAQRRHLEPRDGL